MQQNQILESLIKTLLFDNDFVVVPGFGAFICKEIPAKISSKGYTLIPPTKELVFNPKVTASDGLLEQQLVLTQNFSYSKAEKYIETTVSNWKYELTQKGQLTINDIGVYRKNASNQLVFKHFSYSNFSTKSFGLEIARIQPLKNNLDIGQASKYTQPAEQKTIVIEKFPVSYLRFKRISIAAIVILSVSASYLYMLSFNPSAIEKAGLNFFDVPVVEAEALEQLEETKRQQELVKQAVKESSKDAHQVIDENATTEMEEGVVTHTKDSAAMNVEPTIATETPTGNVKIEAEEQPEIAKSLEVTNKSKNSFHVIAASLSNEEKLEIELKRLKLKGFEPVVIKMDGKIRISIGNFATKDSAVVFKENILNDNSIDSWILSK